MTDEVDKLLQLAQQVAAAGAVVHQQGFGRALSPRAKSSEIDLVSEIDLETEQVMVAHILRERPRDGIISEEGTNRLGQSDVCWILDPLDGTTNYLYGYPAFGIAVGVEINGHGVAGIVYDTSSNHLYAGAIERGATCDSEPIMVSACSRLETALIATGFLPDRRIRWQQGVVLAEVLPQVRDVRRSGSPILDLCGVACGRLDGFYEWGLGRWDITAGAVIAKAAGATVTVLPQQGSPSPLLVASTPGIHAVLLEVVSSIWKRAKV